MNDRESAPKMRRLENMTIYTGRHWGVGYVVTKDGVWWTHQGDAGVEDDDEKAFKKALKAIEERDGKEQSGEENKSAASVAGNCASGASGSAAKKDGVE